MGTAPHLYLLSACTPRSTPQEPQWERQRGCWKVRLCFPGDVDSLWSQSRKERGAKHRGFPSGTCLEDLIHSGEERTATPQEVATWGTLAENSQSGEKGWSLVPTLAFINLTSGKFSPISPPQFSKSVNWM